MDEGGFELVADDRFSFSFFGVGSCLISGPRRTTV